MNFTPRLLTLAVLVIGTVASAAAADEDLMQVQAHFWRAYNECDMQTLGALLTDDVEFYHDQTGLTASRPAVVESLRKGPCGDATSHLRRELVSGTLELHSLAGGYALLTGKHRFYVVQPGKEDRLGSEAAFSTVWKLDAGHWRMHRIVSFDHVVAPYIPPKPSLSLPEATLRQYVGHYNSARIGDIAVSRDGDHLKLTAGNFVATLYPETPTRFFAMEKDLRFDFELAASGRVEALAVYENGAVTERAKRVE